MIYNLWQSISHFFGKVPSKVSAVKQVPKTDLLVREENRLDLSYSCHEGVKAQMAFASQFITILPLPICLIDKKGFVHYANDEFNRLVTINISGEHRPYVGRFFTSHSFRDILEKVSSSELPIVVPFRASWNLCVIKDTVNDANAAFQWTLSGCSSSEAIVIAARYFLSCFFYNCEVPSCFSSTACLSFSLYFAS